MRRHQLLIGLAVLLVAGSSFSVAQTITASLQGQIVDKSGAVLPKATITVANTETGFSRSTTSSASGEF